MVPGPRNLARLFGVSVFVRRLAFGISALILASCGGSGPNVAQLSPSRSTSPSTSPSSPSRSALRCQLPVLTSSSTAQTYTPAGGFVTFPGGDWSPDPNGTFVLDGSAYRTVAQPHLRGGAPDAYDWTFRRWLPTSPRSVSPDGSHYAYFSDFDTIHDVDVATGDDRPLKGPAGPDTVIYYAKEGIYFNHAYEGPAGPGLWLLNPTTGAVQTVFTDKTVDTIGGYAAWLPGVNPDDPHPAVIPPGLFGGVKLPNEILRRDLNGGPTVVWFYRPGRSISVLAFDQQKQPLIAVESGDSSGTVEIWQVPAANQGLKLFSSTVLPWGVMSDNHGIWFADHEGISLYTPSQGLQKVSAVVGHMAGACR